MPKGRPRSARGGVRRADEFSRPTEEGAGPQSPHGRLKAPKGARIDGWGGKASAPTAINSIVGSPGPNSHRPHNGVWAQYPLRGWPEERGPTQPIPGGVGGGGRGALPGPPAPGRQLWGAAHPPHTPRVGPQSQSGSGRRLRPPPRRGRSRPVPTPPFFFLSISLFFSFLILFPEPLHPGWEPPVTAGLCFLASPVTVIYGHSELREVPFTFNFQVWGFPPPPFPSFCVRVPPFVPALREAAMKAAAAGP